MIVLVSGMPRSGTAWSYNVCQKILEHDSRSIDAESGLRVASDVETLVEGGAPSDRTLLISCHFPGPRAQEMIHAGEIRCVYTYRDPRDATASLGRTFGTGFKNASRTIHKWLAFMDDIERSRSSLGVAYARIATDAQDVVNEVATFLGIGLSAEAAAKIAKDLDRESMRSRSMKPFRESAYIDGIEHDKSTGLTRNHIPHEEQSDWKRHLSQAEGRFLTWLWRDYLERFGIPIPANEIGSLLNLPERWYYFLRLRPWKLPAEA